MCPDQEEVKEFLKGLWGETEDIELRNISVDVEIDDGAKGYNVGDKDYGRITI